MRRIPARIRWVAASAALIVSFVFWSLAQPAPAPLADYVPPGPLLCLEAKDFGSLLADWNGSAEKTAWLQSDNDRVFSRSRLFLRLTQAQQEFAAAAGLPPGYELLESVAGSNSLLALYNIGNLEFLYLTRLPQARALDTALWKSRASYQTRNAAGIEYYFKQDAGSGRSVAFTFTHDMLLVATREDLMAGALALIAGSSHSNVQSERWFDQATAHAQNGARDLRMVLNMEKLVQSPHFRSYWVQGNVSALRPYYAALSDLERSGTEFRERRVLLRTNPSADRRASEASVAGLVRLAPPDSGLYRAWADPASGQVLDLLREKIFPPGARSESVTPKTAPVVYSGEGVVGSEQDLEVRIDEAPLVDSRLAVAFEPAGRMLETQHIQAMLEIQSSRTVGEGVFVDVPSAIVLLGANAWNADAVRRALSQAAGNLWTTSGLGVGWTAKRAGSLEYYELAGLGRVAVATDGRMLMVTNQPGWIVEVLGRPARPTGVEGAVYAAGFRLARELPNFQKMMRLIDQPLIQTEAFSPEGGRPAAREPAFFSENLASLGRVLHRVDSASITVHDDGSAVSQLLVYRLTQ